MGEIGEDSKKLSGGTQCGGNVLQGGDTGGTTIWLRYLGNIGGNGEDFGGGGNGVSNTNHGESSTVEDRRDMGYYQVVSSSGSGGNPGVNDLHCKKNGYSCTVGGAVTNM